MTSSIFQFYTRDLLDIQYYALLLYLYKRRNDATTCFVSLEACSKKPDGLFGRGILECLGEFGILKKWKECSENDHIAFQSHFIYFA